MKKILYVHFRKDFAFDDDDDDDDSYDDGDDELLLWNGRPRKAFSVISSRDHCNRSPPSQISNTPPAGLKRVIMKVFVNNCINPTCIVCYLSKTIHNCLVVVKSGFSQYDLLLIFTKVWKIYAIVIITDIPDLKPLFWIREPLSCCYSISFWGY